MNNIEVTGGIKSQRDKVESMVQFCIEKLMPRMQTLDIDIRLKSINDANGYCTKLADTKNPREFDIEVDYKLSMRQILETVAHEMVHVKQYARNEMCDADNPSTNKTSWKSNSVCTKSTEYWDLPWEIEAHGREVGLFVRWAQANGYANTKWANV
tara:strand:+ start:2961 stop:3425 length:465 start_codon:yes stop_codon:yes gene_type:complete